MSIRPFDFDLWFLHLLGAYRKILIGIEYLLTPLLIIDWYAALFIKKKKTSKILRSFVNCWESCCRFGPIIVPFYIVVTFLFLLHPNKISFIIGFVISYMLLSYFFYNPLFSQWTSKYDSKSALEGIFRSLSFPEYPNCKPKYSGKGAIIIIMAAVIINGARCSTMFLVTLPVHSLATWSLYAVVVKNYIN